MCVCVRVCACVCVCVCVCVCQDEGDPATSVEELEKQIEKLSKVNSDVIINGCIKKRYDKICALSLLFNFISIFLLFFFSIKCV